MPLGRFEPEAIEAGVLEGGIWGVKVRWPGAEFVDGMLADTARRLADRMTSEGGPELAQKLRQVAHEADQHNVTSEAMHQEMTEQDDPGEGLG